MAPTDNPTEINKEVGGSSHFCIIAKSALPSPVIMALDIGHIFSCFLNYLANSFSSYGPLTFRLTSNSFNYLSNTFSFHWLKKFFSKPHTLLLYLMICNKYSGHIKPNF
ncbi:hypothetical protein O181_110259 [Austropuccinia psidii MF-1]|uniref:Uncharacterized protein n=1 Tax=Austropuccinia psidii MF-1 TaxID=1389203 RepID=A0A9Q3PQN0_9BASI|nr:hypothetical protein [Austropuccinia psidii MF-1]